MNSLWLVFPAAILVLACGETSMHGSSGSPNGTNRKVVSEVLTTSDSSRPATEQTASGSATELTPAGIAIPGSAPKPASGSDTAISAGDSAGANGDSLSSGSVSSVQDAADGTGGPSCELILAASELASGEATVLKLSTSHRPTSITLDDVVWDGGATSITLLATHTFQAVVTSAAGEATCLATAEVRGAQAREAENLRCSIVASVNDISSGDTAELTVTVTGEAATIGINGSPINAAVSTLSVSPQRTEVFTATVGNATGQATCATIVNVRKAAAPTIPACKLSSSARELTAGSSAVLSLAIEGSANVTRIGGMNFAAEGGTLEVIPEVTTIYTAVVGNEAGASSCQVTVRVAAPDPNRVVRVPVAAPPTCRLSAPSTTVAKGTEVKLSMKIAGDHQSFELDGGAAIEKSVTVNATKTYAGKVTGIGGSSSCSLKIATIDAPTCTLSASNPTAKIGEKITLKVATTGTSTTVELDGQKASSKELVVTQKSQHFTASVSGSGGTGTCQLKVAAECPRKVTVYRFKFHSGQCDEYGEKHYHSLNRSEPGWISEEHPSNMFDLLADPAPGTAPLYRCKGTINWHLSKSPCSGGILLGHLYTSQPANMGTCFETKPLNQYKVGGISADFLATIDPSVQIFFGAEVCKSFWSFDRQLGFAIPTK